VPTDFSIVISYTGAGLKTPSGIAVDNSGDVWLPNSGNNTVTKLDALGVTATDTSGFLSGGSGFTAGSLNLPAAIAIDASGNAWVANSGNSTVSQLDPAGTGSAVYTGGGLSSPSSIAIDAGGNAWIANEANSSVTEISAGTLTNYIGAGITTPTGIAINPN
jgi:streptogramin lyase